MNVGRGARGGRVCNCLSDRGADAPNSGYARSGLQGRVAKYGKREEGSIREKVRLPEGVGVVGANAMVIL